MATKNEFAAAFHEVLEDKQLPREIIVSAIESAMVSAYRRAVNASTAQLVEAKLDPETGRVTIFAEKEVVEDIMDPRTEVLLDVARQYQPEVNLGDMALVETTPADFGRVAAQTARQVIQQRIREAERGAQMEYFNRQVGEIVSGVVQNANNAQGVTIGLDMKAEGNMPSNQKIPGERFKVHERVRAVVLEVKEGGRGPQIILSRAHRNFLRRLMENEVPEIYHGIVEIRAIAREPGARAKVAVSATQPGVDPVGACVGQKGMRIQAIVRELHDEKIDIVQWYPDSATYITKAISPAQVTNVYLNESDTSKTATVVVSEDQLSLAIGRDGQNARLAAKLTGWRIDIKSVIEAAMEALSKLQADESLQALLPAVMETVPQVQELLAKKAENRPLTPEEYEQLKSFVDRVERRTIQMKEAALRADAEKAVAAAHTDIPSAAFQMKLEEAGLRDHVFNILTEAGYASVGELLASLKSEPDKVLGLSGIGPKAMQNIEETLAALTFHAEESPVEVESPVAEAIEAVAPPAEKPETRKPARVKEEAQEADETTKDGVSLEEMFVFKPESFTPGASAEEDDASGDKKKKKKGKKKGVELEFDEDLGEVVGRKIHKRGDEGWEE
ncbi:MAG: hypothetical protein HFACDABA_00072 [Anaerolineales bacterium]|nr:hypothetical protein [Anaerolineales bacterium]